MLRPLIVLSLAAGGAIAHGASSAFGPLDHSLCCGPRPASIDGGDPFSDANRFVPPGAEPPLEPRPAPRAIPPAPPLPKLDLNTPLEMVNGYAKVGFERLANFEFSAPT